MNFPVQKILAYFTKICIDKEEIPYFDRGRLVSFFHDNKRNYPLVLGNIRFNEFYVTSEDIEEELFHLMCCRMLCSWGPDFHPHQTSKAMLIVYNKIPDEEKKKLSELANKFYENVGCYRRKFKSIDNLF